MSSRKVSQCQMSQYATLFAHSRKLGATAVISGGMRGLLRRQFWNVTIEATASDDCLWNWTIMNEAV